MHESTIRDTSSFTKSAENSAENSERPSHKLLQESSHERTSPISLKVNKTEHNEQVKNMLDGFSLSDHTDHADKGKQSSNDWPDGAPKPLTQADSDFQHQFGQALFKTMDGDANVQWPTPKTRNEVEFQQFEQNRILGLSSQI